MAMTKYHTDNITKVKKKLDLNVHLVVLYDIDEWINSNICRDIKRYCMDCMVTANGLYIISIICVGYNCITYISSK